MNCLSRFGILVTFGLLSAPTSAVAIVIGFEPASLTPVLGESIDVDVVISGLESESPAEIVSAFDLEVQFNPSVLSPNSVSFGSFLGGLALFQSIDLSTSGVVDFAEVSLLDDATLSALQPDTFTLATLSFDTLAAQISPLTLVINPPTNDIKGLNARVLPLDVRGGSVTVSLIPEPGMLMLVAGGLAAVTLGRSRFSIVSATKQFVTSVRDRALRRA